MIFRWFTKLLTGEAFLLKFGNDSPAPQQQAAPTTQNVTQTSIPEYARPYVETMLGKAQALTDTSQNPYQQYQGNRIAEFTPMQQQAFQNLGQAAPAGQLDTGTALAGATGIGSLMAGRNYAQQATNPYAQQAYMSPYIQNALQPQLQEMQRQYDITGQQERGRATAAGAFGGTRQALMQAENDRNRNIAMNQAIGQGYQSAFDKAQQAQQFGATLGLQGLGQAGAAAATLGQLGQNQYQQAMGINAAQQQAGAQQQAQNQQYLSQNYQDFLNQQNYPYKQIGFMSDLVRGLPLGQQSTAQMYQAPPSTLQTVGALGMGAYGAKQLGMYAEGGQVDSYADGGEINAMNDQNQMADAVDKLTDEQLKQIIQRPSSAAELQAAQLELATRASERSGLAGAYNMAQGGMVAFDEGGSVPGSYAPGNPALYSQALQNALGYNAALSNFQPSKGRTREEQKKDAEAYFKQAQEMGGPDPYADYEKTLKGFDADDANMLSEGKGLAAFQGMGAILEGNDAIRGIGKGFATAGATYGQTLKEARARKRASAEGLFQLASERRKERMGLGKEALAREAELAKAIREGDKERVEVLLKQGQIAAAVAAAAKPQRPTGGGGGGTPKGYDALNAAILAAKLDPKNPTKQAAAQAAIEAAAAWKTSDIGPTKADLTGQGLGNTSAKDIQTAQIKAREALLLNREYNRAPADVKKTMEAESDRSVEEGFRRNQRSAVPGAKPAAGGPSVSNW